MTAHIVVAQPLVPPAIATAAERDKHVRRMTSATIDAVRKAQLRDASITSVDLIAFPELSTISYNEASFNALDELAEDIDVTPGAPVSNSPRSPSLPEFARLAATVGCAVCFGVPRRDPNGVRWISQVVVSPDGCVLGHFDKMHMVNWGEYTERRHFGPQPAEPLGVACPPLVLSLCGGAVRVAPIICYDFRFPEQSRYLAAECGVHAILHASAFPRRDPAAATRAPFILTRAVENQCYFVGMNRAGPEFGDTIVAKPTVASLDDLVHFTEEEQFVVVKVEAAAIESERRSRHFLADRLPSAAYAAMKAVTVDASQIA